tara:strand:+ start:1305 stop:2012 length:708 start_codon:yes stop_codon:yes gene_type:complete
MNKHHRRIVKDLNKYAGEANPTMAGDSYTGSNHFYYAVRVPTRRKLIKNWLRVNADLSDREKLTVVDSLFHGKSHEEKTIAAYLLGYCPGVRKLATHKMLEKWLYVLVGWAEVDALCQNIFTAEELLADWNNWEVWLIKQTKVQNISLRRSSLVFLTWPTVKSSDERLHDLAYQNIDTLKYESDILITKAISWLLRSMAETRPKSVVAYLEKNEDTLPKIAMRETRRKLKTGKKN